jgi:hypothetical protein
MSNLSRRRRAQGPFGDRFRMARKLGVMDVVDEETGERTPALRVVIRDRMRSLALRNDATWKETHP